MATCSRYTRKQWMTLIVFSIAQFCNAVVVSLQAPFYPHEAEMKGATATQYSFVFGIFELTVFIISPIYGQYLDNIGVNFLNNSGIFTVSVCCILFGFLNRMRTTTLFLTYSFIIRIVEAMGNAAFITSAFSIIAQEFPLNVGSAFATLETFFGLGLIAGPTVGGALYEIGGFTLPFVTLGCVLLAAAATVYCFLPKEVVRVRVESDYSVPKLLRHPRILLSGATTMAASLSIGFLQAVLEPHIRPLNLSPFEIGLMFVLNGLTYAISAPIVGFISDRGVPERVLTCFGSLLVTLAFMLIGPSPLLPLENSLPLCITALIIHGLGFGAQLVCTFSVSHKEALQADLPDDLSTYGLVSGLWASSFALGAFIGPSVAGVLYDSIGFPWATTCVAALHLFVAVITFFCCFCCETRPLPERLMRRLGERTSLLRSSSRSSTDDSTYGSADTSTENIAADVYSRPLYTENA